MPALKLVTVECFRATEPADDRPHRCTVLAHTGSEAVKLSREAHAGEDFAYFSTAKMIYGMFPGRARVLHYAGRRISAPDVGQSREIIEIATP